MAQYRIISLRQCMNGFKQREIKSAGRFSSYEEACAAADKLNEKGAIYTTYTAQKVFGEQS